MNLKRNEADKRVIKNFKSYLVEEAKEVYFTFGRMNPPTIGHGKVLETIAKKAGGADWKVYASQSVGPKDPLSYSDKIKHLRKMFPKYGRNIMVDKGVKNVFDISAKLYDQGYKRITMVVGEDRLREFEVLLNKYNGKKARHGFYNFESINVVSAGRRDPDAEGVEGMSASKQRANAKENDYQSFTQGVPKGMSEKDTRRLFNDVRKGMGLKEEVSFKRHIEMPTVSETREQFVKGELFELGDTVVIKESEDVGIVSYLGANYVIVECGERKMRKWLDAVELVEKKATQDPDIKDKEGTQPKKYYAGLKKGTKDRRDAHFKKHGKKADDDDSAYKPAPGDKGAKTKPSKYTKAFKDMYDEDCWDGYKQVGMKKKGDKSVPNCVPVSEYGGPKISRAAYLKKQRDGISIDASENAGEEGTDKLLKKYKKDTPLEERKFIDFTNPVFGDILDKLVNGDLYKKVIRKYLDARRKNPKQGQSLLVKIARQYGVPAKQTQDVFFKLLDKGALPKHLDWRDKAFGEDAVQQAKDSISREKEQDKAKHDRILDRARLARAKAKNRETE